MGPEDKEIEENEEEIEDEEFITDDGLEDDEFDDQVKTMKKIKLPDWDVVSKKKESGEDLNPLEEFIYMDEPATGDARDWKEALSNLIEFVRGT